MNTLDRMIAAVSPQRAVKRAAARRKLEILDSGYSNYGASQTKKSMLGWLYGGGSAKEDIPACLNPRPTHFISGKSKCRNPTSPFYSGFAKRLESP